ncbi:MAG: methyltransferase domain-containing protein [Ruminococcus sp.]|nr:methyltransferase domain-containing protein [Ruminococcus sp.]
MPEWNPIQYEKFLKDRTQPAIDLANRIEEFAPNSILDLGCGPGNSTKVLMDIFPTAKIIGADNSDEMLEKARGLYPDIEFINLDVNSDLHEINEKFDIVFSNACIQWLSNHHELLPKLTTLLKPNGILAIQIPMQREHPVHMIISELTSTAKWSDKLTPRQYNNLTTEEYSDVLSDISSDYEIWKTTYCHRMPSYESIIEWYKGTGLRPYLEQLTEPDAEDFVNDVFIKLKQRYKMQKNGEILFRFPRLFFIARKD